MTTPDPASHPGAKRRRRANGDASREKILDAAAEIAGERGYEGTSISRVSERSGLPASSIYWHFKNKDELIAAVIDRSFHSWVSSMHPVADTPTSSSGADALRDSLRRTGKTLGQNPDFLRLGLMLILERRPDEPTARQKFLDVRRATLDNAQQMYATLFPELATTDHARLAALTIAAADGILIGHEIGDLDMTESFDLLTAAMLGAAERLRHESAIEARATDPIRTTHQRS
ncbi:MAG: TetR/AcrR family transcriptional regulator, partial [Ilumatobacter sp.]|nr:TetR/AcrR family transcriptional regulator [Ilumatobacter sp.]